MVVAKGLESAGKREREAGMVGLGESETGKWGITDLIALPIAIRDNLLPGKRPAVIQRRQYLLYRLFWLKTIRSECKTDN